MMNIQNIMQMLSQFRQNPMQILSQRGINVPQDIANNPQSIVQYMLNQGVITQEQVNQAMQMAKTFPMK